MAQTAPGPRPAPGTRPAAGETGASPPPGATRPAPAPRPRTWPKTLLRWAIRFAVAGVVVIVMLLPYPYQTGGPFEFLPMKRAEVRSEVEGLVEAILVREGETVKAGQPIARIASRAHEKNLKATIARLEEQKAQLALLQAGAKPEEVERALADMRTAGTSLAWSGPRADRYAKLFEQKLISDQDLENAQRQKDLDQARLDEAKANLELVRSGARPEQIDSVKAEIRSLQALVDNYEVDVERTTLTSPIDGRVVTPRVEELAGTYLKPGQRDLAVQIEDAHVIQAQVEVPEEDAAAVRTGAQVKVVPWAYHDRVFLGKVISIAPVASTNAADKTTANVYGQTQGTAQVSMSNSTYKIVRVLTEIPNDDALLKTDMTGYAKIATEDRPVWDVLFRPLIRWCKVQVWYWIP
ncbi:MAG TPA: efflux RND transporter periplasmic adaptor subunit [Candidatus Polarisedimenticolia bacterium]|nr:efflux RND transporter periplasmic adaptor subunit [Candidatus Polarisedimenticolia bacterium]